MKSSRGSALIAVLLLSSVLLVAALAANSQAVFRRRALLDRESSLQALALAQSGIEDFRVKLALDQNFPPKLYTEDEQKTFTYSESLSTTEGLIGSYEVTVDVDQRYKSASVYVVTSIGTAGPSNDPKATRTVQATLKNSVTITPGQEMVEVIKYSDFGGY